MFSRPCHIFLPDIVTLLIYSSSDLGPALSGHFSTVLLADTIWKKKLWLKYTIFENISLKVLLLQKITRNHTVKCFFCIVLVLGCTIAFFSRCVDKLLFTYISYSEKELTEELYAHPKAFLKGDYNSYNTVNPWISKCPSWSLKHHPPCLFSARTE